MSYFNRDAPSNTHWSWSYFKIHPQPFGSRTDIHWLISHLGIWPSHQAQKVCEYFSIVKTHWYVQLHSVATGSQLQWQTSSFSFATSVTISCPPGRKSSCWLVYICCPVCPVLTLSFTWSTDRYPGEWGSDDGGTRARGNRCWEWVGPYYC